MFRATTPCTFSTSQLPKVFRTPQFLTHFDFQMCFAPQRRALFQHLNFQKRSDAEVFCTFSLRNWLRATTAFQPSGATKPRKNTVFRDFPTFSRTCIFFLLIFSLLTLLPADCFSSLHIVGSLTSKLPSIIYQ